MVAPDILHQSTAAAGALEAQAHIRADETAVADLDILHPAGHLAANHESSVTVIDCAVGDDEIAALACVAPAVRVLSGLYADGVIPNIEGGPGEDNVLAGVDVDAVFFVFFFFFSAFFSSFCSTEKNTSFKISFSIWSLR